MSPMSLIPKMGTCWLCQWPWRVMVARWVKGVASEPAEQLGDARTARAGGTRRGRPGAYKKGLGERTPHIPHHLSGASQTQKSRACNRFFGRNLCPNEFATPRVSAVAVLSCRTSLGHWTEVLRTAGRHDDKL